MKFPIPTKSVISPFSRPDLLILDATAFVSGFNLNLITNTDPQITLWITPGVFEEIKKHYDSENIILTIQNQGILNIVEPIAINVQFINEIARKTGDLKSLSDNDRQLIALSYEIHQQNPTKNVQLMSDDYSIQNVCAQLGIQILKFRKQGIKKHIRWEIYCPDCFMVYSSDRFGEECERCGALLKRRPYKGKRKHL
jgi:rRNA maturation endonuclease Nob1